MDRLSLKPLPYDIDALEPHIGRETVGIHYAKHHAGYARKLKELIAGKAEEKESLEQIIRTSEGAIFENAAQIWNHDFYWRSMHPDGGGAPSGVLQQAILSGFGSFENLRRDFLEAGTKTLRLGLALAGRAPRPAAHHDHPRRRSPDPLRRHSDPLRRPLGARVLSRLPQRPGELSQGVHRSISRTGSSRKRTGASSAESGHRPGSWRRSVARPARLELATFRSAT